MLSIDKEKTWNILPFDCLDCTFLQDYTSSEMKERKMELHLEIKVGYCSG